MFIPFIFFLMSLFIGQAYAQNSLNNEYVIKIKSSGFFMLNALNNQNTNKNIRKIDNEHYTILRPQSEDESTVLKELRALSDVEFAEPNIIYDLFVTPTDIDYSKQWGLHNTGQLDGWNQPGRAGLDVGAEKAWDISVGSKKIIIAVIDSGLNYNHPEIKDNLWTNEIEANGQAGLDDDNNGYVDDIHGYDFVNNDNDPMDDVGHGTHVSSIIGAKSNDGLGMVGVNWNISIMPLKFATAQGKGNLEASIKAIQYATKMGAKIINLSWGNDHYSEILEKILAEASSKNVLFVAAAGNSSRDNDLKPTYPANYKLPNMLSVAGLNMHGYLGAFSCFGINTVHIAAPGAGVYGIWNTIYKEMSGTSMAAPYVSGVAGLLLSKEPELSATEIKERLMRTSTPLGGLRNKVISGGMVNAYYALTNQLAPADPLDPTHWQNTLSQNISSNHPYLPNNKNQSWEIYIPEAKYIALYFEKMEIEKQFDMINFFDRSGRRIARLTGKDSQFWSPIIAGDYIKIVLATNSTDSIAYGFDITKAAYVPSNNMITNHVDTIKKSASN